MPIRQDGAADVLEQGAAACRVTDAVAAEDGQERGRKSSFRMISGHRQTDQ
jgi:hypothetical protein